MVVGTRPRTIERPSRIATSGGGIGGTTSSASRPRRPRRAVESAALLAGANPVRLDALTGSRHARQPEMRERVEPMRHRHDHGVVIPGQRGAVVEDRVPRTGALAAAVEPDHHRAPAGAGRRCAIRDALEDPDAAVERSTDPEPISTTGPLAGADACAWASRRATWAGNDAAASVAPPRPRKWRRTSRSRSLPRPRAWIRRGRAPWRCCGN